MAEVSDKNPLGAGRPEIEIDWKRVENMIIGGANGSQVSAALGVHSNTLYDRVKKQYGINFSEFYDKFREKGNQLLHNKQFDVALKGNTTMLVWLGKQRLEQKDSKEETNVTPQHAAIMNALIEQITIRQELAAKKEKSNGNDTADGAADRGNEGSGGSDIPVYQGK